MQEQLTEKDLPMLRQVLPVEFSFTMLKGRGNYLCTRRLQRARQQAATLLTSTAMEELARITELAKDTTAGRLSDLVPAHYMIYVGLATFAVAYALMARADVNTPFWTVVGLTVLMRAGTAFTRPVTNAMALNSLPSDLVNQGASTINFVRNLGAAIGTNCVIVFLELRIPFHGDAFVAMQTGTGATGQKMQDSLIRLFANAGVPEFARAPGAVQYLGDMIYAQASTMGYQDAFMILAVVAVMGVAPAWVMARSTRRAPALLSPR